MAEKLDIVVSLVDKASANLASFESKLEQTTKQARNLGIAFTAAGAAVTTGAIFAVKEASNLNESINALNVTFGDASTKLLEFSEIAAQKAGLSMTEFNQAAVPIGALLTNMGFSLNTAADSTIALTQRAADMASVFNTTVPEALAAISSGLRGQTEPLLAYGANLSAAEVSAHALSIGLIETNREMSEGEKTAARLSLLMEQTSITAGDFANTSESLANRLRIMTAEFDNVTARIGDVLIPILEDLLRKMEPVIEKIIDWIEENPELTKTIVLVTAAIGAIMAVLGPLLILFGSLGAIAGALGIGLLPLIGIIGAVGAMMVALAAQMIGPRRALAAMRKAWPDTWNKIVESTERAVQFIADKLINRLVEKYNLLMRVLGKTDMQINTVSVSFERFKNVTTSAEGYTDAFMRTGELTNNTFSGMDDILSDVSTGMSDFGGAASTTGESLSEAMDNMGEAAEDFSKEMNDALSEVQENIENLQKEMDELVIGKIQDTNDERMDLAQAYLDQEKEAADLRQQLARETDAAERAIMEERLAKIDADLAANKHLESIFAEEMKSIREDEQKTALQLAKDRFQENILMIEQEFEKKMSALQQELNAELAKEATLLQIQKEASEMAQKFLLEEEKATIESVNRQISAFNQLASAVQNAKRGVTTGSVGLGATMSAREQLEKVAASSVVININDANILNDADIVDKIGDPIMREFKKHFAVV